MRGYNTGKKKHFINCSERCVHILCDILKCIKLFELEIESLYCIHYYTVRFVEYLHLPPPATTHTQPEFILLIIYLLKIRLFLKFLNIFKHNNI